MSMRRVVLFPLALLACSSTPAANPPSPIPTTNALVTEANGPESPAPSAPLPIPATHAEDPAAPAASTAPVAGNVSPADDSPQFGMIELMSEAPFDTKRAGRPPPQPGPDLDPSVIQTIVRARFAEMRGCYEAVLAKDPQRKGRVSTRFTFGVEGKVIRVTDAGSDAAMRDVAGCVRKVMATLIFPARASGKDITVVYPIDFEQPP